MNGVLRMATRSRSSNLVLVQRTNFNGQMTHKKTGLGRTLMRKFVWKNFEICAVGTALSLLYLTGVISFLGASICTLAIYPILSHIRNVNCIQGVTQNKQVAVVVHKVRFQALALAIEI